MAGSEARPRYFEIRHVVGFEETSLVGNVYYVNYLRWQGRCREMFLHQHVPGVVTELAGGLALATLRCSCEYLDELVAFDEVAVRLRLGELRLNRILMLFEYWRVRGADEQLVARGEQEIACLRRAEQGMVATPVPPALVAALEPYR